jgi:hypothetical protein
MDKAHIEAQLSDLFSRHLRRPSPRRLRVYAEPLDKNFEVFNPSGRPPSADLKLELAKDGIRMGWKTGVTISRCQVSLLELSLAVHAHLGRSKA